MNNTKIFLILVFPLLQLTPCFAQDIKPVIIIDPGVGSVYIKNWLVAGMFPSEFLPVDNKSAASRSGYDRDFLTEIGGETKARVKAGTSVTLANGKQVTFQIQTWDEEYIDLLPVFGDHANVCAYLYTELMSLKSMTAYFHVGINDAGKVWLNGDLIVEHPLDGGLG